MARTTHTGSVIEHALGTLGLLLLGLTGWAAERLEGRPPITAIFLRLILTSVAAVGRFMDRPAFPPDARSRRASIQLRDRHT